MQMPDVKLPEFKLNRNFTLFSKLGFVVHFEKGVPRHVPQQMMHEVIAIGAERVDGSQDDGFEEDKAVVMEPSGQEREDLILAAIEDLVERNSQKDFTAGGVPKSQAIKAIVGFEPESAEVKKAWLAFHANKSEQ
jgi:hypothetical protein